MSNTFIDAKGLGLIARDAQYEFKNSNSFLSTAYTGDYKTMWNGVYNPGDTINIRLPNTFITQTGDTVTAQSVKERSVPLTLEPVLSVPLTYTTTELTESVGALENWKNRILFPAVRTLVADLNARIAAKALTQVNLYTGDETANISTYANIDNAGVVLEEHAVSRSLNWYSSLYTRQAATLRQSSTLQNMFNEMINKNITLNSSLGRLAGFDMFSDQSIPYHTTYTATARTGVTVKTDVTSGSSTITLTGLTVSTTGIVKAGDLITFTGIYSVNPLNRNSTTQTFQVVATADANSDGSGDAVVSISPAIISDTTNPNRNVSTAIIATTPVTFEGSYRSNLAWAEDGLIVVCPQMDNLDTPSCVTIRDPDTGYSLRLSKSAEILDNKNIMRLDLLWGALWMSDRSVKILSL